VANHRDDSRAADPLAALRRFELGTAAVRALAVVAVLVALGAGLVAWRSRPTIEPLPPADVTSGTASADPSPAVIVVAVTGRVHRPGLVELPPGSRVADAIEAAGGVLPDTDLSTLNVARKVIDGELISVGVAGSGGVSTPGGTALIDLNTATVAELDALPGVGPVLAQRIVAYREQHGGFRSVDELKDVTGIGEATFVELEPRVTV
jgi:competence protein ComEA